MAHTPSNIERTALQPEAAAIAREARGLLRELRAHIDAKAISVDPFANELQTAQALTEIEGTLPHDAWWPTWIDEQERRRRLTGEQARNLRA
jgi:hypothetical protein